MTEAQPNPAVSTQESLPLPKAERKGIGLCLSGGGYRATLFHSGALRRLNEFGVLTRPDFRTVSSVSGGSIAAALLARLFKRIPEAGLGPIDEATWDREFAVPLRELTRQNIRTLALARRLLPWNWARTSVAAEALAKTYESRLTDMKLVDLPPKPNFILCATDMAYGVNWEFTRQEMGDYMVGYKRPPAPSFPLGRAVAASACFPPLIQPLPAMVQPSELVGGDAAPGPNRDACINGLRLTDGGNYDNMALEPVWKDHAWVLVSDASGLFVNRGDSGLFNRALRYQEIEERQSRGLRRRWLIANFKLKVMQGTYWGVGGAPNSYGVSVGYAKNLAETVIGKIRTDLDAFSDAEASVLENHGYLLVDAAIRVHAPAIAATPAPPLAIPHPEWMDESRVREALRDSGDRAWFGHW